MYQRRQAVQGGVLVCPPQHAAAKMRRLIPFFSFVLVAFFFAHTASAQDRQDRRTIEVSGEATVRVEPDMAVVRLGVVSHDEHPEEARRLNAEAAREALNAVRELGVEERLIRMETLRLQPRRVYDPEHRRHREEGFEAVRVIVVELEDLELLPTLIAEVVERGANRLEQVRYDLRDRSGPRNEALRDALTNARENARLMAETLDVELGRVVRISEQQLSVPYRALRLDGRLDMEAATPEPEAYAPGEIEVEATVQVIFELE